MRYVYSEWIVELQLFDFVTNNVQKISFLRDKDGFVAASINHNFLATILEIDPEIIEHSQQCSSMEEAKNWVNEQILKLGWKIKERERLLIFS